MAPKSIQDFDGFANLKIITGILITGLFKSSACLRHKIRNKNFPLAPTNMQNFSWFHEFGRNCDILRIFLFKVPIFWSHTKSFNFNPRCLKICNTQMVYCICKKSSNNQLISLLKISCVFRHKIKWNICSPSPKSMQNEQIFLL